MEASEKINTQPILNLAQHDSALLERWRRWLLVPMRDFANPANSHPLAHRHLEGSVAYAKRLLGKQMYCRTFLCKCWVWVGQTWVLYASKRGLSLEVIGPEDYCWNDVATNVALARKAMDEFLTAWNSRWVAERLPFDWKIECDNGWWTCTRPCRPGEAQGVLTEGATLDEALESAEEHERRWKSDDNVHKTESEVANG